MVFGMGWKSGLRTSNDFTMIWRWKHEEHEKGSFCGYFAGWIVMSWNEKSGVYLLYFSWFGVCSLWAVALCFIIGKLYSFCTMMDGSQPWLGVFVYSYSGRIGKENKYFVRSSTVIPPFDFAYSPASPATAPSPQLLFFQSQQLHPVKSRNSTSTINQPIEIHQAKTMILQDPTSTIRPSSLPKEEIQLGCITIYHRAWRFQLASSRIKYFIYRSLVLEGRSCVSSACRVQVRGVIFSGNLI